MRYQNLWKLVFLQLMLLWILPTNIDGQLSIMEESEKLYKELQAKNQRHKTRKTTRTTTTTPPPVLANDQYSHLVEGSVDTNAEPNQTPNPVNTNTEPDQTDPNLTGQNATNPLEEPTLSPSKNLTESDQPVSSACKTEDESLTLELLMTKIVEFIDTLGKLMIDSSHISDFGIQENATGLGHLENLQSFRIVLLESAQALNDRFSRLRNNLQIMRSHFSLASPRSTDVLRNLNSTTEASRRGMAVMMKLIQRSLDQIVTTSRDLTTTGDAGSAFIDEILRQATTSKSAKENRFSDIRRDLVFKEAELDVAVTDWKHLEAKRAELEELRTNCTREIDLARARIDEAQRPKDSRRWFGSITKKTITETREFPVILEFCYDAKLFEPIVVIGFMSRMINEVSTYVPATDLSYLAYNLSRDLPDCFGNPVSDILYQMKIQLRPTTDHHNITIANLNENAYRLIEEVHGQASYKMVKDRKVLKSTEKNPALQIAQWQESKYKIIVDDITRALDKRQQSINDRKREIENLNTEIDKLKFDKSHLEDSIQHLTNFLPDVGNLNETWDDAAQLIHDFARRLRELKDHHESVISALANRTALEISGIDSIRDQLEQIQKELAAGQDSTAYLVEIADKRISKLITDVNLIHTIEARELPNKKRNFQLAVSTVNNDISSFCAQKLGNNGPVELQVVPT